AVRRAEHGAAQGLRGARRRTAGLRPIGQALGLASVEDACHTAVASERYFGREAVTNRTHGQVSLQLRDRERSAPQAWHHPSRREGDRPAEAEADVYPQPALSPPGRKLLAGGGALARPR